MAFQGSMLLPLLLPCLLPLVPARHGQGDGHPSLEDWGPEAARDQGLERSVDRGSEEGFASGDYSSLQHKERRPKSQSGLNQFQKYSGSYWTRLSRNAPNLKPKGRKRNKGKRKLKPRRKERGQKGNKIPSCLKIKQGKKRKLCIKMKKRKIKQMRRRRMLVMKAKRIKKIRRRKRMLEEKNWKNFAERHLKTRNARILGGSEAKASEQPFMVAIMINLAVARGAGPGSDYSAGNGSDYQADQYHDSDYYGYGEGDDMVYGSYEYSEYVEEPGWSQGGGYRQYCGGVLVHERWVLTAAHCLSKHPKEAFQLWFDVHSISGGSNYKARIVRVETHRDYSEAGLENDLAMVEVDPEEYACFHCQPITLSCEGTGTKVVEECQDPLHANREWCELQEPREPQGPVPPDEDCSANGLMINREFCESQNWRRRRRRSLRANVVLKKRRVRRLASKKWRGRGQRKRNLTKKQKRTIRQARQKQAKKNSNKPKTNNKNQKNVNPNKKSKKENGVQKPKKRPKTRKPDKRPKTGKRPKAKNPEMLSKKQARKLKQNHSTGKGNKGKKGGKMSVNRNGRSTGKKGQKPREGKLNDSNIKVVINVDNNNKNDNDNKKQTSDESRPDEKEKVHRNLEVCQDETDPFRLSGVQGRVLGWGRDDRGEQADTLRQVDLTIHGNHECREQFARSSGQFPAAVINMDDTVMCAGGDGVKAQCSGDSGGPLMAKENGIYRLEGIISWSAYYKQGCGFDNRPGVYSRILPYKAWLQGVMATAPPPPSMVEPSLGGGEVEEPFDCQDMTIPDEEVPDYCFIDYVDGGGGYYYNEEGYDYE